MENRSQVTRLTSNSYSIHRGHSFFLLLNLYIYMKIQAFYRIRGSLF